MDTFAAVEPVKIDGVFWRGAKGSTSLGAKRCIKIDPNSVNIAPKSIKIAPKSVKIDPNPSKSTQKDPGVHHRGIYLYRKGVPSKNVDTVKID